MHRRLEADLRRDLGDRFDEMIRAARDLDIDEAITDLARSQPED